MEYKDFNDFELLSYINENDEQASDILFKKYEPLIVSIASRYSNYCGSLGLDINDLIQEGRIALNKAINKYEENKDNTFFTFARICIERRIKSAIVMAKRQKHRVLNESVSIDSLITDTNISFEKLIGNYDNEPEKLLIDFELKGEILEFAKKNFSDIEYQVFELYKDGFDYKEIALIIDKDIKTVNNALQRIKFKLKNKLLNKRV